MGKAASIQVTSKLGVTVFVEWIVLCARQIAQAIFEAILVPDVILTASMQVGGQTSCATTSAPTSATTFPPKTRKSRRFKLMTSPWLKLRSLLLKNPPRLKTPGANPIAWIICARISIKAASIQVTSKLGVTVFVEWIVLCARQIAQAIFEAILVPDVIL